MYYKDAQAVIFVIDSADRLRMAVARDELEGILSHDDITKNNALFLFFANALETRQTQGSRMRITNLRVSVPSVFVVRGTLLKKNGWRRVCFPFVDLI